MNEFLTSVKADLLDRRMLPLLVAAGVALAGALAYVVLSGGASGESPSGPPSQPPHVAGIAVTQAPANPNQPVSETTNGYAVQRGGGSRDPFTPLPSPKPATTTPASSGKGASSSAGTTTAKTAPVTPAPSVPSKPAPTPKPRTVYQAAVLFGTVPPGTQPGAAQLTPYTDLKLFTALPSAKLALVVYRGVTAGGKQAVFTLVGEAIIHGNGTCKPSTFQCQAIELAANQAEQLEYLSPTGEVVVYELRLVSIASTTTASKASVTNAWASDAKAARQLLGQAGLLAVPGMSFSAAAGVLVATPPRPAHAHAHVAAQPARPRA
ncbi:MAG TPA: hypothetical protein VG010_11060 [Solirubrobacteraceae bacterium]|jgi:hypothetical protein|nr:hypothetical protein [Solirubrobacteraceae bacterium]